MSVVDIEIGEFEDFNPIGKWMCMACHTELVTRVNIGFRQMGDCQRCGNTRRHVYQIDEDNM